MVVGSEFKDMPLHMGTLWLSPGRGVVALNKTTMCAVGTGGPHAEIKKCPDCLELRVRGRFVGAKNCARLRKS